MSAVVTTFISIVDGSSHHFETKGTENKSLSMKMYLLSYIPMCLLLFVVSESSAQSDMSLPFTFGRPDEVLLFAQDDNQESGKQRGLGHMRNFAGSISILTSEFNKTETVTRGHVASPSFMLDLYNALENRKSAQDWSYEKKAIRKSDTIRSYSARLTDVIQHEHTSEVMQRYVFDLSVLTKSERLRLAELRIPILQQQKAKKIRVTLYQLHEVKCLHNASETCYRRDTVSSQKVKQDHLDENEGVVVFKVTKAVKRWIKSAVGRHVIEVGIPDDLVDDIVIVHQDFIDSQAILVTYTYTKERKTEKKGKEEKTEKKREERSADATNARKLKKNKQRKKELRKQKLKELSEKSSKKDQHPCKKISLTVDFEKIGWGSWVIYPKKFDAYQCVGECEGPMSGRHNPNNHAIMQGLLHMANQERAPKPCCIPTKLAPLSMLYFEHGKIVVKEHENMIVEECGCR
ncbi:nodal homolog 3-A-like [Glandiceps talaboti]